MPNVIDSFFSNKNKVNSILQKVKKQRRKSLMDFNIKLYQLSKEEKNLIILKIVMVRIIAKIKMIKKEKKLCRIPPKLL